MGLLWVLCFLISGMAVAQKATYQDNFEQGFNADLWFVETLDSAHNSIYVENGQMIMDVNGGATIWLKHELTSQWTMEFDRTVLVSGKINDRVANVDFFWQASDPYSSKVMGRKPLLASYDSLSLYYAKIGAENNTLTEFGKYQADQEHVVLLEYTDKKHLLEANKVYHFRISVQDRITQLYVNDRLFFSFTDEAPLPKGYFGFRTTKSRQSIDNFKVVQK